MKKPYVPWMERTESARFSFIKGAIRSASTRYPPRYEVLAKAKRGKRVNAATGKMAEHYECNICHELFPAKMVITDHIDSVVDVSGFNSWDEVIKRMFCNPEGLQILCKTCHNDIKTKGEREERLSFKKLREKYPREYNTWSAMNRRCYDENFHAFKWYGARGISVCERWHKSGLSSAFRNFLNDMGERPENKTLDRIDFDGNYTPDNCRWADELEQKRNTSRTVFIDLDGDIISLQDACEAHNISPVCAYKRLKKGFTPRQALGLDKVDFKGSWLLWMTQGDIEAISSHIKSGKRGAELQEATGLSSNQIKVFKRKFLKQ